MSYKIAVASSDGIQIDETFGAAKRFLIYEVEDGAYRRLEERAADEDKTDRRGTQQESSFQNACNAKSACSAESACHAESGCGNGTGGGCGGAGEAKNYCPAWAWKRPGSISRPTRKRVRKRHRRRMRRRWGSVCKGGACIRLQVRSLQKDRISHTKTTGAEGNLGF